MPEQIELVEIMFVAGLGILASDACVRGIPGKSTVGMIAYALVGLKENMCRLKWRRGRKGRRGRQI